jgi:hypothetical protein
LDLRYESSRALCTKNTCLLPDGATTSIHGGRLSSQSFPHQFQYSNANQCSFTIMGLHFLPADVAIFDLLALLSVGAVKPYLRALSAVCEGKRVSCGKKGLKFCHYDKNTDTYEDLCLPESAIENCHLPNHPEDCCGPCCNSDEYNVWGPWSACSESCGGGARDRMRECSTTQTDCGCRPVERGVCNTQDCCQDNGDWSRWGPWGDWGSCSEDCVVGTKERTRLSFCGNRL